MWDLGKEQPKSGSRQIKGRLRNDTLLVAFHVHTLSSTEPTSVCLRALCDQHSSRAGGKLGVASSEWSPTCGSNVRLLPGPDTPGGNHRPLEVLCALRRALAGAKLRFLSVPLFSATISATSDATARPGLSRLASG